MTEAACKDIRERDGDKVSAKKVVHVALRT